jgi:hypothetical protein
VVRTALEGTELFGWKFLNDNAKFHRSRKLGVQRDGLIRNPFGTFLAPFGPPMRTNDHRWFSMVVDFSGESQQDGSGISWL